MKLRSRSIAISLLDIGLLAFALITMPFVLERPSLPFALESVDGRQLVADQVRATAEVRAGDRLLSIDGIQVDKPEEVDLIVDRFRRGGECSIQVMRGQAIVTTTVTLVPFYPTARFGIAVGFVGVVTMLLALFLVNKRPNDSSALLLHWALVLLALTILLTQGAVDRASVMAMLRRYALYLVYPLSGSLFVHFALSFPRSLIGVRWPKYVLHLPTLVIASIVVRQFRQFMDLPTVASMEVFVNWYDVFHGVVFIYGIATLLSFLWQYRIAETTEDRQRVQWILWGCAISVLPFLLFIVLPQLLVSHDLIAEDVTLLCFLVLPFSLVVSMIKHHLLDIDLLVNRSIVYLILSVIIGGLYIFSIMLFASTFDERVFSEFTPILLLSILVVVLLNPLRERLKRFVDGMLFPLKVKYQQQLATVLENLEASTNESDVVPALLKALMTVLPFESAAAYCLEGERLTAVSMVGSGVAAEMEISGEAKLVLTGARLGDVVVASTRLSPDFHRGIVQWLRGHSMDVLVPIKSSQGELLLVVGARLRGDGAGLRPEERDFISAVARDAAGILERFRLHEQFILEREERKKTEALNRLKSDFVSTVSHELRTPLTSIRMFAEMMPAHQGRKKVNEYSRIIEGESGRLTRLIDNILDFSKIERGVREYHFEEIDLCAVVRKAIEGMAYQFDVHKASLRSSIPSQQIVVRGDEDALEEVFINLLSNALKYSTLKKQVAVRVRKVKRAAMVEVRDRGIGISMDRLASIFDSYYRTPEAAASKAKGMGLGLAVSHHIVQQHGGKISVKSAVGTGSTFTVTLPLLHRKSKR